MTDISYKAALTALNESGARIYFQTIVSKIASLEPVVPRYNYSGESNIEEIKYKLAQKNFYDTVMQIINPKG